MPNSSHDQSPDPDDDLDFDDHDDGGKPGRKKGASGNQAARRDQNRIAQREFRLRKQQRIRDLEARVEILSGTKEESQFHVRAIIQGLIDENTRLRNLLKDLGSFISDGLGGPLLERTGWTMAQFHDIVGKAESDTAYEAFMKSKQALANGGGPPAASSGTPGASGSNAKGKSSPMNSTESSSSAKKRKRDSVDGTPELAPPAAPGSSAARRKNSRNNSPSLELPTMLPSRRGGHAAAEPQTFGNLVDAFSTSSAAPFVEHLAAPVRPDYMAHSPFGSGGAMSYPLGSSPEALAAGHNSMTPTTPGGDSGLRHQQKLDTESKRQEAGKMIKYHLDNYRRNENYFLPPSLRPTLVQRTVPHDPLIDGVLYPEIRDRMILLKDQYDLPQCLTGFITSTVVHGDDVLAHTNWEPGEEWLRTYGYLIDASVLTAVNKWRRQRGDQELSLADINPDAVSNPQQGASGGGQRQEGY